MEEKDNLEKAMTLMSQALKQYEEGKFDLAEHSRTEANRLFDEMSEDMSTQEGMDKMKFGESRNFGMLYSILEANSKKMYASNLKSLARIAEEIRRNPVLLSEFRTYNAFTNPTNVQDAEAYVNEAVSLAERHTKSELKMANSKLLSEYRKLGLDENVESLSDDLELYEDIEYVITHKPDITNINRYAEVKKHLSESVRDRNVNETGIGKHELGETIENAYGSLADKCNEELNRDEIALVEEICASKDGGERKFNEIKEGLARKISAEIASSEGSERERWSKLMESVLSKTYSKSTALVNIAEMIEADSVFDN